MAGPRLPGVLHSAGRRSARWSSTTGPGCGLSGPWPGPQGLDADVAVLEAVADHLGLDTFDLLGISLGAPVSVAFAARFPQRVGRLILYGGYADGRQIASPEVRAAMLDMIRAHWGLGSEVLADVFLPEGSAESQGALRAAAARGGLGAGRRRPARAVLRDRRHRPARAGGRADAGRAPARRPRDSLPGGPRSGRADPRRAAGVAARQEPLPLRGRRRRPSSGRSWSSWASRPPRLHRTGGRPPRAS